MVFGPWGQWFLAWASRYGYAALFVALLLEGTGLPVLVEIPYAVAGLLIARGQMSLLAATFYAAAGNVIGNVLGYLAGAYGGRPFVLRYGRRLHLPENSLELVERWFARYGDKTVLLARWFGIIRTPTIFAAGIARMDLRKYVFYAFLGAFSWCLAWIFMFERFGRGLPYLLAVAGTYVRRHGPSGWAALAAAAAAVVYALWRVYRGLWRRYVQQKTQEP